jgi:UDP-4-amino-4,6-dideoxy-N-acetyl-beta-L-altrosamine transaminase
MNQYIPYGKQNISQEDINAVIEILQSDWLTQGPAIAQFEKATADYCGVKYAVAVSSATAGLHLSCLALNLGENELLWTSPITFVASANCGLYCRAKVDFVDINPHTYNLSVERLAEKLKQGKIPKIVIPVHLAGQSCERSQIYQLSQQYGFKIIEDASHAIGAEYQGQKVGNCQYSDLAVFSFHPVKIITTGEGGIITTNNEQLYQKLIRLRTHGITRNPDLMTEESHGGWYYQQLELGFNYRITDIQAGLGLSQMKRLDEFVAKRRYLAQRYNQLLADLPITLPYQHPDTNSSWHLYIIRLKLDEINKTHREVFDELRKANIGVNLHYIPVHLQPYYQNLGFNDGDFAESESYYRSSLSIPLYYDLSEQDQDYIVNILKNILTK